MTRNRHLLETELLSSIQPLDGVRARAPASSWLRRLGPAVVLVCCAAHSTARADAATAPGAEIIEKLGDSIDRSLRFRDHTGRRVTLDDYVDGTTPVLFTLNYYRCRTLCDLQLARLAPRLRELSDGGSSFRVVTVSIDPRDDVEQARSKRAQLGAGELDWSFLVASSENASALASALGASFRYVPRNDQYAHTPAVFFVSPLGKITRYLYGIDYALRDLRFALIDSAAGKPQSSSVEQVLLSCFEYDPSTGRYTPYVLGFVRLAAGLTLVVLGITLVVLHRRSKRSTGRD